VYYTCLEAISERNPFASCGVEMAKKLLEAVPEGSITR
jgi:hypothetical protein